MLFKRISHVLSLAGTIKGVCLPIPSTMYAKWEEGEKGGMGNFGNQYYACFEVR